ncbi:MAG: hypothetical protein AAGF44_01860 [Pseudomonadota bacterium]
MGEIGPCPCLLEDAEHLAETPAPTRVITLIHGTFDTGAPWTRAGPLVEALAAGKGGSDQLGGITLFSRFCWSGRNSHTARLAAGEALAERLSGLMDLFPDAHHHLIGHSHGGNIIMYAVKRPEIARRVRSMVTLATPFLSLKRRRLPTGVLDTVLVLLVLLLCEVGLNLGDLSIANWSGEPTTQIAQEERWAAWWGLGPLLGLYAFWIFGGMLSAFSYQQGQIGPSALFALARRREDGEAIIERELNQLDLSPCERDPDWQLSRLLVIRPIGDEASMALIFSQFLSWMQTRILAIAVNALAFFFRFSGIPKLMSDEKRQESDNPFYDLLVMIWSFTKFLLCFALAFAVLIATYPYFQYFYDLVMYAIELMFEIFDYMLEEEGVYTGNVLIDLAIVLASVLVIFVVLFWLPTIVFLVTYPVLGAISLIGLVISMLAALAFGRDAMIWSQFAVTSAEATPPGPARVYLQSPPAEAEMGMAHNMIYTDPAVIGEITAWIEQREAAAERDGESR